MSHSDLVRLRVLVGYLGEKAQFGWWPTEFYAGTSEAFLAPVFGKTVDLARYNGVLEAARGRGGGLVGPGHEDGIGLGPIERGSELVGDDLERERVSEMTSPAPAR